MGQKLAYWGLYAFTHLLSRLPMFILYGLSNLLYWLAKDVFKYRREVVYGNLRRSFPEKAEQEIQFLLEQFYRHFCDFIVETLKSLTLSDKELAQRMKLTNPEIIQTILDEPQGGILLGSHHGNFEWMLARIDLMAANHFPTFAIYTPLSNQNFDRLMRESRQRRGVQMLPMRKAMIQALRQLRNPCLFGFIGDQSPSRGGQLYYTTFLGQATPVHTSISKIAIRAKANLYYADVRKVKRGHYTLTLVKIDVSPYLPSSQENIDAFTDEQARILEASIRSQPAYWLWSHKRWKHAPREGDRGHMLPVS